MGGQQQLRLSQTTSEKMAVPEKMLGSFQMETSEGFDEFMYELGVNVFTRKIAINLYPLQEIRMEDDQMCIDTFTSFKNTKTKFPLGTAWEEYTADGRTTQTITTIEGNSIIKVILKSLSPLSPSVLSTRPWSRCKRPTLPQATTPPGKS